MANDLHPLLGALGLCRKAGKLLHGYDRVQENALRGKVALVLLAADASERTVSHMRKPPARGSWPAGQHAADLRRPGGAYPQAGRRVRHYGRTPCAALRETSCLMQRRTTVYGF